jgi:hypothetical protein
MAILTSSLGNLSGKVGNLVFRVINGKNYVSKAPGKQKGTISPERKSSAIKFGATGKIAAAINSVPELQDIWKKQFKTKKSVFTKIFKSIYGQMTGKDFNKSGSILPVRGFPIKGLVTTGRNNIFVEADAPGENSGITEVTEKFIQAAGIIVFKEPVNCTVPETKVSDIVSWPPQELRLYEPQLFCFVLNSEQQQEMQSYGKKEYHIHLVTRDEDGEVASFSEMIE